jgi:hypothetical protein
VLKGEPMLKIIVALLPFLTFAYGIEAYRPVQKYFTDGKTLFVQTRQFTDKHKTYGLFANTHTLQTQILPLETMPFLPTQKPSFQSPFEKAVINATSLHVKGGMPKALVQTPNAVFLTMDLCPSRKHGYESDLITQLTTLNGKTPIAIAITSVWIDQHPKEFKELISNPLLDITWVNHTHTHFYDKTLADKENFMLHANTDIAYEILELEKKLIEMGTTPSLFFRFPGLMANEALMKELRETYSLIPLGANAWIAKHEPIKEGSFILIHGNKNEPEGISMLEKMLPEMLKNYRLKPINEAFVY